MVRIILVIRCELPAIANVNRPVKRQETWLFLPCPWLLLPLFRLTLPPLPPELAFRTHTSPFRTALTTPCHHIRVSQLSPEALIAAC